MAKTVIGAIGLTPAEAEIRDAMRLDQQDPFHDSDETQKRW
jgi:hypothetical protein